MVSGFVTSPCERERIMSDDARLIVILLKDFFVS
jgi:hypothetical protein